MTTSRRYLPKAAFFVGCAPLVLQKTGSDNNPSHAVCKLCVSYEFIIKSPNLVGVSHLPRIFHTKNSIIRLDGRPSQVTGLN